jgi:predicted 2-oxoglutarate/Fe(II)-dependent dioxygenase YbiX
MFPSWTPHCVSNITRGTRYALVAWVHGTPFR